jgi:hypothetical protein
MLNTKKVLKILLLFALLIVGVAALEKALPLSAQTEPRIITIVPPGVYHNLKPGGTAEGTLKVINDSPNSLTFKAFVRDFIVTDTQGTPNILAPNTLSNKYSLASWLGVTPDTFTVAPREKQTLNYFVQVPKDARPGGHYAAVVYEPVETINIAGTGTGVKTQIGTLFYVTVEGPIKEQAFVTRFLANKFQEYGPVDIQTTIKNVGDQHITPQGGITLFNIFGKPVESQSLHSFNIFPEAARDYKNTFGGKFMVGRYTAVLSATYGKNNNLSLSGTLVFWIFPWRIATIVVLVIIAAVLALLYYRKTREEKKEDKQT